MKVSGRKAWSPNVLRMVVLCSIVSAVIISFFFLWCSPAEGRVITVDDDGGADYTWIQSAIYDAEDGDTIKVYEGTYTERFAIYDSISLIGNGTGNTTIDGDGTGSVVTIRSDHVNITGFTITGSGNKWKEFDSGIFIESGYNNISGNNISDNRYPIYLFNDWNSESISNTISNNDLYSNYNDIYLSEGSHNTTISDNHIFGNYHSGISVFGSNHTTILNNTIEVITNGIYLSNANFTTILNNMISLDDTVGFEFENSYQMNIRNNTLTNSTIRMSGTQRDHWAGHIFDDTNIVDGRPVLYYSNLNDTTISDLTDSHIVIIADCSNVTLKDQMMNNTYIALLSGFSTGLHLENITFYDIERPILFEYTSGSLIQNCTFISTVSLSWSTIKLVYSDNNQVVKNNFSAKQSDGIILSYSQWNIIQDNSFFSLRYEDIELQYSHFNTVENNHFLSTNSRGIYLIESQSNLIIGNLCPDKIKTGIYLLRSDWNNISSNNCSYNTLYGIHLERSAFNNISFNICDYNNESGIYLESDSDGNILESNTCEGNVNGIDLHYSDHVIFYNNSCMNNDHGLYLTRSVFSTIRGGEMQENIFGYYLSYSGRATFSNINSSHNSENGIYLHQSSSCSVNNSTISYNKVGIYFANNILESIHNSSLFGNTELALERSTSTSDVLDCRFNWWGHDSGPYVDGMNNAGLGDTIPFYVDFDPWMGKDSERGKQRTEWYIDDDAAPGGNGSNEFPYLYIHEATLYATNGDIIRVAGGEYRENLMIKTSISLIGEGNATTFLMIKQWGEAFRVYADHVNISGFNIEYSNNKGAIYLRSSYIHIFENNCSTGNRYGLYIESGKNILVENNTFSDNFRGIEIESGSESIIIENNTCTLNQASSISIDHGHNITILNNNCSGSATGSLTGTRLTLRHSSNITVTGNNFSFSITGIYLYNLSGSQIRNNTIIGQNYYGIDMERCDWNEISGNLITTDKYQAINHERSSHTIIRNNFLSSIQESSLKFWYANNITTENNTIAGESHFGIVISSFCEYLEFHNNSLIQTGFFVTTDQVGWTTLEISTGNKINEVPVLYISNAEGGHISDTRSGEFSQIILANCSNFTVSEIIFDSMPLPIQIGYSSNITIEDVIINSPPTIGIRIERSKDVIIQNVTITSLSDAAIYLRYAERIRISNSSIMKVGEGYGYAIFSFFGEFIDIHRNTIIGQYDRCIYFTRTNHGDVTGNTIEETVNGIYLSNAENIAIRNNSITQNWEGLYISGGINLHITGNSITQNDLGIYLSPGSSSVTIQNNDIYENSGYGLQVTSNVQGGINAINNWWGDGSGPYHESKNPEGKGNGVSNYVNFDPWLEHESDYFPPTAVIDTTFPEYVMLGEAITFSGHGIVYEEVSRYVWTSSIDGQFYNGSLTNYTLDNLRFGEHVITFMIRDDRREWSPIVSTTLRITDFPVATIQSIAPSPAHTGTMIHFKGKATNYYSSARYLWRSSINGELYDGYENGFSVSTLDPGLHTITLRVLNDVGLWSEPVNTTLIIMDPPQVVLSGDLPEHAAHDDIISLRCAVLDDTSVLSFVWRSSLIEDDLYNGSFQDFQTSLNVIGTHIITLTVHDTYGFWTEVINTTITIHSRSVIFIDGLSPNPGIQGKAVSFTATVQSGWTPTFIWTSDIDGEFYNGNRYTFTYDKLSPGTHTISLVGLDYYGIPSLPVTANLIIESGAANIVPTVDTINPDDDMVVNGSLTVKVIAEDEDGVVEIVQIQIDGGSWINMEFDLIWTHELDTTVLTEGKHTLHIRSYDGTSHSESDVIQITVDNDHSIQGGDSDDDNEFAKLVIIGVVAVFAIVSVLVVKGNFRKTQPKEGGKK